MCYDRCRLPRFRWGAKQFTRIIIVRARTHLNHVRIVALLAIVHDLCVTERWLVMVHSWSSAFKNIEAHFTPVLPLEKKIRTLFLVRYAQFSARVVRRLGFQIVILVSLTPLNCNFIPAKGSSAYRLKKCCKPVYGFSWKPTYTILSKNLLNIVPDTLSRMIPWNLSRDPELFFLFCVGYFHHCVQFFYLLWHMPLISFIIACFFM